VRMFLGKKPCLKNSENSGRCSVARKKKGDEGDAIYRLRRYYDGLPSVTSFCVLARYSSVRGRRIQWAIFYDQEANGTFLLRLIRGAWGVLFPPTACPLSPYRREKPLGQLAECNSLNPSHWGGSIKAFHRIGVRFSEERWERTEPGDSKISEYHLR